MRLLLLCLLFLGTAYAAEFVTLLRGGSAAGHLWLGNTDTAGGFLGDVNYACSAQVLVSYTIEWDADEVGFRSYQGFNHGTCTLFNCSNLDDTRVGSLDGQLTNSSWISLPLMGECPACARPGSRGPDTVSPPCHWRLVSVNRIVKSSCLNCSTGDALAESFASCPNEMLPVGPCSDDLLQGGRCIANEYCAQPSCTPSDPASCVQAVNKSSHGSTRSCKPCSARSGPAAVANVTCEYSDKDTNASALVSFTRPAAASSGNNNDAVVGYVVVVHTDGVAYSFLPGEIVRWYPASSISATAAAVESIRVDVGSVVFPPPFYPMIMYLVQVIAVSASGALSAPSRAVSFAPSYMSLQLVRSSGWDLQVSLRDTNLCGEFRFDLTSSLNTTQFKFPTILRGDLPASGSFRVGGGPAAEYANYSVVAQPDDGELLLSLRSSFPLSRSILAYGSFSANCCRPPAADCVFRSVPFSGSLVPKEPVVAVRMASYSFPNVKFDVSSSVSDVFVRIEVGSSGAQPVTLYVPSADVPLIAAVVLPAQDVALQVAVQYAATSPYPPHHNFTVESTVGQLFFNSTGTCVAGTDPQAWIQSQDHLCDTMLACFVGAMLPYNTSAVVNTSALVLNISTFAACTVAQTQLSRKCLDPTFIDPQVGLTYMDYLTFGSAYAIIPIHNHWVVTLNMDDPTVRRAGLPVLPNLRYCKTNLSTSLSEWPSSQPDARQAVGWVWGFGALLAAVLLSVVYYYLVWRRSGVSSSEQCEDTETGDYHQLQ
eukprot:gnl/Spiro4/12764_TR6764_c0_g1_i1.p1 gnl/Spiro4/12764_TR6764_c0_g1~~gnl/Spiro4/12764_TR6764_c0_g1_i1.p1  ORF type:complete len:766 (+),score=175.07 gnl/Spiro4/12764_TR6764_c0_g1_i1:52-2349(+)